MRPDKYLRYFVPSSLFGTRRTKEILHINPTAPPERQDAENIRIFVYDYAPESLAEHTFTDVKSVFSFKGNNHVTWINIDGLRKADVEQVSEHFGIHPLIS